MGGGRPRVEASEVRARVLYVPRTTHTHTHTHTSPSMLLLLLPQSAAARPGGPDSGGGPWHKLPEALAGGLVT